jgi:hypothetical protein
MFVDADGIILTKFRNCATNRKIILQKHHLNIKRIQNFGAGRLIGFMKS